MRISKKKGLRCDLNHIDVSRVTDMNFLFEDSKFNGSIDKWDTSKVVSMRGMFKLCSFKGSIAQWDTTNVKDMSYMFWNSQFKGDLSKWNVSNVKYMESMFQHSVFKGNIEKWNTSNVINMLEMFESSEFNSNISCWNVENVETMSGIFEKSKFRHDISRWLPLPSADIDSMFDLTVLLSLDRPTIAHWHTIEYYALNLKKLKPAVRNYYKACQSMLEGMGIEREAMPYELQRGWLNTQLILPKLDLPVFGDSLDFNV